ncbi:hypothetical protein ACVWZ4_000489 [Bradyrhizobium sp. USDA 4472]
MLKKLTSDDQGSLRELGIADLAHVDEGMIDAS